MLTLSDGHSESLSNVTSDILFENECIYQKYCLGV